MLRITSSLCSFALDCDSPAITNMIIQTANLFPFFKQRNKTTQAYMQEPTTRKKHRYQTWGQFASAVFRHSKWIFPEMKHGVQAAKHRLPPQTQYRPFSMKDWNMWKAWPGAHWGTMWPAPWNTWNATSVTLTESGHVIMQTSALTFTVRKVMFPNCW